MRYDWDFCPTNGSNIALDFDDEKIVQLNMSKIRDNVDDDDDDDDDDDECSPRC